MSNPLNILGPIAVLVALGLGIYLFRRRVTRLHQSALARMAANDFITVEALPIQIGIFKAAAESLGWRLANTAPGAEGAQLYAFEQMDARSANLPELLEELKKRASADQSDEVAFPMKIKATGSSKDKNAQTH